MVRVDGHLLPLRHVVDDAVVRLQLLLLFGGEDLQGQLPRRSVDAEAGDVPAPALRLLPAVLQGAEAPSFKEALAHVLDVALDMRLGTGFQL